MATTKPTPDRPPQRGASANPPALEPAHEPTSGDTLTALAGALARLCGAVAQQVRGPELDGVVQLGLYRPDQPREARRVLLEVWARDGRAGAWRTGERRPNRTPQGSFTMFLRKHLVGQRLVEVRGLRDGIALGWARGGRDPPDSAPTQAAVWLVAWRGPGGRRPQLAWIDARARCRPVWPGRPDADLAARVASAARATPLADEHAAFAAEQAARGRLGSATASQPQPGSPLRRQVRAAMRRQRRLVRALTGDLAQASQAETLRAQGEVLKISLHRVPPGAAEVTLAVPWLDDAPITVPLRRDLSPAANLARIFRRARGFARHAAEIEARLASAQSRLNALEALLADFQAPAVDVVALQERAAALAVRGAQTPQNQPTRRPLAKLPAGVSRYETPGGAEVLLGKNAVANDKLVTRLARGRDIWMHVRGRVGAHLLLRHNGRSAVPPPAELLACAALVAWGSGVSRGDRVDVTWTHARHVRKTKGAPPGLVYVSEERTLYVEVDGAVIDGFRQRATAARRAVEATGKRGS